MGSWDCYCAICSATVALCEINTTSRTKRRAVEGKAREYNSDSEQDDDDSEACYDPEVITEDDVGWVGKLHILGFNPNAPGVSKAFLSGPGECEDYGGVTVESGDDPNFADDGDFCCYINYNDQGNVVFPFHWPCYELLVKCMFGTSTKAEFGKVNKDLLYNIMSGLCLSHSSPLDLDYGDPHPPVGRFWESNPGEELLVSTPSSTPFLQNTIKSIIESSDFKLPYSSHDLGLRVRQDEFSKLPYDLIHKIACLLPQKTLIKLSTASWSVNSALRNNHAFWKTRIRRNMPWFFELQQVLDSPDALRGKDLKGIFIWADKISTPKLWMSGPFMGLANRRRIWKPCKQLTNEYISRSKQIITELDINFVESMIRKKSACANFPVVSSPPPRRKDQAVAYWVHSWEDIYTKETVLEIFWSSDGSLVGLSVAPKSERRLFGQDDSALGVSKELVEIEDGLWITGFILHIPTIQDLWGGQHHTRGSVNISIKGLTVIYNSGNRSHLGATNRGHSRRPLLAAKSHFITGITGQMGEDEDGQRILRMGLLQAKRITDDYCIGDDDDEDNDLPKPTTLESHLWRDDCSEIYGRAIWEHPTIKVITSGHTRGLRAGVHDDLVPYEALIWATDENELRTLTRLSGHVTEGGRITSIFGESRPIHDLCGIRAQFGAMNDTPQHTIGIQKEEDGSDWKEKSSSHFDIDGPGGEYVNEISFSLHEAMKFRTNRNREIFWGEEPTNNWQILRAPENETIVGVLMTFCKGTGYSREDKTYKRTKLSSVAALTMPLGIANEN